MGVTHSIEECRFILVKLEVKGQNWSCTLCIGVLADQVKLVLDV